MANFFRLIITLFFTILSIDAYGQTDPCYSTGMCVTQSRASANCSARLSWAVSIGGHGVAPYSSCTVRTFSPAVPVAGEMVVGQYMLSTNVGGPYYYNYDAPFDCSKLITPGDPDYIPPFVQGAPVPGVPGSTWDAQTYKGNSSKCSGGCIWNPQTGSPSVTVTLNGSVASFTGFYYPTGESCGATDPVVAKIPPPKDDPVCTTYASGQKMCVKAGQDCYTASTGREICWATGQTGNKTDGPVNQQTVAGPTQTAAPLAPPGEVLIPTGSPATTQTTTSSSSSSSTTTTTTSNFTTQYGSNSGPTNQGQSDTSSSGSSTPSTSTSGSSAGGGSCSAPYTCTGTNGVECAQLEEQRQTRCGTTDSNTILGSIVSAETGNGTKLDAANSSLTAIKNLLNGTTTGTPDAGGSDGGTAAGHGFGSNTEYGASGLDASGLGFSQTCPTIPDVSILGHTLHFDTSIFCTWMTLSGKLLLIACAITSLLIIVRN